MTTIVVIIKHFKTATSKKKGKKISFTFFIFHSLAQLITKSILTLNQSFIKMNVKSKRKQNRLTRSERNEGKYNGQLQ